MAKSSLEKFYISEKFDENRNITFNFKKANQKISGNFKEFVDALQEFIRISEKTKNETRVWFHRDGAYRGSVNIDKARIIVEKVMAENVVSEEAIAYIEKEELVDKPTPAKKSSVSVNDLNTEAQKTTFFVENASMRKASQISAMDIKSESKYTTIIEKISQVDNTVVVTYHLEHGEKTSKSFDYVITGFALLSCACRSRSSSIYGKSREERRTFWTIFTILTLLIITNIVLIVLRLTEKI
ncbi:hypothetical protein [Metamycoplasma canadense]|uniref:Uncharacterized protein n=1 Tax=Metamycoplasma canadense TaxID=29554 RepID=A0A077L5V2_9BACT|nr:hypothetical protein [Metamycoplasma canadense]BAP39665.1 hypothetical protein MCAN360_0558 [Metamycoplasma canadense]